MLLEPWLVRAPVPGEKTQQAAERRGKVSNTRGFGATQALADVLQYPSSCPSSPSVLVTATRLTLSLSGDRRAIQLALAPAAASAASVACFRD